MKKKRFSHADLLNGPHGKIPPSSPDIFSLLFLFYLITKKNFRLLSSPLLSLLFSSHLLTEWRTGAARGGTCTTRAGGNGGRWIRRCRPRQWLRQRWRRPRARFFKKKFAEFIFACGWYRWPYQKSHFRVLLRWPHGIIGFS